MKFVTLQLASVLAGLTLLSPVHSAEYTPCPDSAAFPGLAGSVCASRLLPRSYADARSAAQSDSTARISIFVRKFPAPKLSRGTVWLVAGGPGESGASLYAMLDVLRRSFPDFDLMIPDHRGTGYSSRLCPQEEGADSPGGMALVGAEWGSCFQRLIGDPGLAKEFSITNAAHDLRSLIAESDRSKPIYVYGVSYGTQLVLRALQIGTLPVSGVILDSLVPLQTAPQWDLSHRSQVVDDVGRKVLAECDRSAPCRAMLDDGAEQSYRHLLTLTQQQPALIAEVPGKNLKRFLGSMLDVPKARERIPALIKDLASGRGEELKAVMATLEQAGASLGDYPQMAPSIPLVSIISASENNLRPQLSVEDLQKEDDALLFSSRLPELLVKPALPSYPRDQFFGKSPGRLPPMLVFGGTLDPKTPYDGALSHIAALRRSGRIGLVSVVGAPHFILWTAPDCFARYTSNFVQKVKLADQRCVMRSAPLSSMVRAN